MARRKRRGGGGNRGMIGMMKRIGRAAGRIVGIVIVLSPAIRAVQQQIGNPGEIPHQVLYNYIGLDDRSGNVVYTQTVAGIGTVVGGVVVMKLVGWALR